MSLAGEVGAAVGTGVARADAVVDSDRSPQAIRAALAALEGVQARRVVPGGGRGVGAGTAPLPYFLPILLFSSAPMALRRRSGGAGCGSNGLHLL